MPELTPDERARVIGALERTNAILEGIPFREEFYLSYRDGRPIPESALSFSIALPLSEKKRWCFFKLHSNGRRDFREMSLSGADLRGADLRGADLSWANLSGANLSGANLSGVGLRRADLSEANLSWANLSEANLSGANLSRADLSEANLSGANLSRADLSRADLSRADLSRADLSEADLSRADLSRANLSRANLSRADLSEVTLVGVDLRGADLRGADLRGATITSPTTEGKPDPMSIYEPVERAIGRKTPPTLMNYSDSPAAVYGGAYVVTAAELAKITEGVKRSKNNTLPDLLLMGVELEVEPFDTQASLPDEEARRLAKSVAGWAILKSDGSLGRGGREIVTRPMTLDAHRVAWMEFFRDKPHEYLSSWKSGRCGLHVHLNRAAISPLTEGKLISFLNAPSNVKFTQDIAGRNLLHNEYAAIAPLKKITEGFRRHRVTSGGPMKRLLTGGNRTGSRHTATNISQRNSGTTLEVRIFRGNIGRNGVFRVLEFLHALVSYLSLNTNSATTVDNWLDFVTWFGEPENSKAYPEFYQWLLVKKYLFPKPIRNISKAPQLLREKKVALLKFSLGEDEPTDMVKEQPNGEETSEACVSF